MNSVSWLIAIAIIVVLAIGGGLYISMTTPDQPNMNTPVNTTPSTTPSASTTSSITATSTVTTTPQATYKNASDMIVVISPKPGESVKSTFTVSGQARGNWYFEASFPLEVLDANGTSIKTMPVQAKGEWMTTSFVPFSTSVSVGSYKGKATLVLKNDNPSGLSQNEKSISIPIVIQ